VPVLDTRGRVSHTRQFQDGLLKIAFETEFCKRLIR
jgi:hypothetical protein